MPKEKILSILEEFKNKTIGVIGDLMLDQFIFGKAERISPEAPVPVIRVEKEIFAPGGAGNTATNIAALGGNVFIVGLIDTKATGNRLNQELKLKKINTKGILKDKKRETIEKIRIVADGQQVVRVDKENNNTINKQQEKKIIDFITSHIKDWDGLVISDYAKGFITKNLTEKIISLSKKYKKNIIADTKPKHSHYFKNVTLITPNHKEAIKMSGTKNLNKAGRIIQKKLNCDVLITQGADGMTLFKKNKIKYFPAKTKEVFDVSGAGDTIVAVLSLALTSTSNLEQAIQIANHAAGIAVCKVGTATVSINELKKIFKYNDK